MTTERSYTRMRDAVLLVYGPHAPTGQQHHAAIEWLCDELDAALVRIANLEALNPEAHTVRGVTASGATVHGFAPVPPPCADGSNRHDMQGQPSCPACGFTPKLMPASEPEQPARRGKHGDPWKFHHPACKKPDDHQGHCIDPKGYEPTEETEEP